MRPTATLSEKRLKRRQIVDTEVEEDSWRHPAVRGIGQNNFKVTTGRTYVVEGSLLLFEVLRKTPQASSDRPIR